MKMEILLGNHQVAVDVAEEWLTEWERAGLEAAERVLASEVVGREAPLVGLECVEVALVDDEASARVHEQFMGVPGATDVITFEHGEIVIGVEVARRQAEEYGEPFRREVFRYLVHGLLHLAGHEDEGKEDRKKMEAAQERIVAEVWTGPPGGAGG